MKIAIVRDYTAPARDWMGAERVVESLVKGLVHLGHEVVMKIHEDSKDAPAPIVKEIPEDCDIIHFNQWHVNEDHDKYNIPWIATIYGGGSESEPSWLAKTINNEKVIAVSKFIANRLSLKDYVWTCSDPGDFIYREKKENYFLWMAGTDWEQQKGLWTAIHLAKKFKFKLKVAGTGQNKRIIETIKSLCDNNVEYLGAINGKEKAEVLSKAKGFFLLTQLPDACPTVISECMFSGTPIIGSVNGAVPEVLTDKIGFVCKNETEIVKAILNIGKINPKDCYDYGMKHLTHVAAAEQHLKIYERQICLQKKI